MYSNKIKQQQYSKKYYEENADKIKAYHKEYYKQHPEILKQNNKKVNAIHNSKRLRYKDKQILLTENPRVGICSLCHRKVGEGIKQTQIHHLEYDDNNPLAHTIELCVKCHREQH